MESVEEVKKGQKRSCEDCTWVQERTLKKPFRQEPNLSYLHTDIAHNSPLLGDHIAHNLPLSGDQFPQSTSGNVAPDGRSPELLRPDLSLQCPHNESKASTSSALSCVEEFSAVTAPETSPLKPSDSNNNKIQNDNLHSSLATGNRSKSASINSRKVYGLRPRTGMKRARCVSPEEAKETVVLEPEEKKTAAEETTASAHNSSGSTQPPVASAAVTGAVKSKSSSKPRSSKSKPLSRYRRITANARERDRMKEINTAFATLRAVLPTFANSRIASMTKYTTLQLAASYIKSLSDILNEAPTSESENKKENCPTFHSGNIGNVSSAAPSNHQNVNLSVGISEIPFSKSTDTNSSQKTNDFSVFHPSLGPSNNFNDIPEEALGELGDIASLPDMCWTLDLMLE